MNLNVSPQEVASIIEALYDGVLRRVAWSMSEHPAGWRTLDLKTAQIVVDSMMSAYVKTVMSYREADDMPKDERFDEAFTFNDDVMDALFSLTVAKSWDEVPIHEPHTKKGKCSLCDAIFGRD